MMFTRRDFLATTAIGSLGLSLDLAAQSAQKKTEAAGVGQGTGSGKRPIIV